MLDFAPARQTRGLSLIRRSKKRNSIGISRREFLQYCQAVPLAFLPAAISSFPFVPSHPSQESKLPDEFHVYPRYRLPRGIEGILRKVPAGFDDFVTEKYQDRVAAVLSEWSSQLLQNSQSTAAIEKNIAMDFSGQSLKPSAWKPVYEGTPLQVWKGEFTRKAMLRRDDFFAARRSLVSAFSKIITAEFQVISIRAAPDPVSEPGQFQVLETVVRFELVGIGQDFSSEQRVG